MVGQRIKELIENQRQYSNNEIANLMDISENSLYRFYKRDSVETRYLEKLCEIFNIDISYFFSNGYKNDGSSAKFEKINKPKENKESWEWANKLIIHLEEENQFLKSIIEKAGLGGKDEVSPLETASDLVSQNELPNEVKQIIPVTEPQKAAA